MATGFMSGVAGRLKVGHCIPALLLCLCGTQAGAVEVGLAGLLGNKALLTLNGAPPRAVTVGQMLEGVRLLSIDGDQAVIEVEGKRRSLRVGQHAFAQAAGNGASKVVLSADSRGHFYALGTINGVSVKFVVDTGATLVSLGASDAHRIGVDVSRGEPGYSNTANGRAAVIKVKLDEVDVGGVKVRNVDGLVHQSDMPIALLGMSFLNHFEMLREGGMMTLKKRF